MVSLSMSIQQVTNRGATGVLQGQRLANSQYDDNSKLAFSFPEETDSPVAAEAKDVCLFFCSNKFAFKAENSSRKYTVWTVRNSLHPCTPHTGKFK